MVFIQIFFLLFISSLAEEKLVFLFTLFRHGARSPTKFYDKSLHLDYLFEKWDNPGELTPTGRRMHYALGLRNREIYINKKHFLSEKFDPHEILIYSTNVNRTLESVASQLQGLYPFDTGAEITKEQKSNSLPPLNISSKVKSELDKMNNDALPFKMSLVPIRMIKIDNGMITLKYKKGCNKRYSEIVEKNTKNSVELKNFIKKFKEDYGQTLNNMYGKEMNYDLNFINLFCDAFIAGITEAKKMEKINENKIDKEKLLNECFELNIMNYKNLITGDKEKANAILDVSKLLPEFIYYMKKRIDADINKEDIGKKLEDFSRPKMLMISAHDSNIAMLEIFFIKVFLNNDDSKFKFPKFATQLTLEVVTENNTDFSKKNYGNYNINCYFNDDLLFSRKVDEFINLVESNIYDDDKLNEFCKEISNYKYLMIIFIISTILLIIIMIYFIIKVNKAKSSNINNDSLIESID